MKNKKQILTLFMMTFILTISAQFGWETHYNYLSTTGRKGCLNQSNLKVFASTGKMKTNSCQMEAFLMETTERGIVNWKVKIGGGYNEFYDGLSVKKVSNGGYVVVGKTTQDQAFKGPPVGADCESHIPYYNAFIFYYNPNNPSMNWSRVFGDENLNDYATEVIEDNNGNYIVTGVCKEKFSGLCPTNNPNVHLPNNKSSKVMFTVFNSNGTLMLNNAYGNDATHYETKYIMQATNGDILIATSSRPEDFNIKNYWSGNYHVTNLLQFNSTYSLTNVHVLESNNIKDRKPYKILETNLGYLIGGEELDFNSIPINSYLVYLDFNYTPFWFGTISHGIGTVLLRDIEKIDSVDYILTGDFKKDEYSPNETDYFAMKLKWYNNTFNLVNNPFGIGNLAHYHQWDDKHSNSITYYDKDGYLRLHLFGNSKINGNDDYVYYVNTDIYLKSGCEMWDSVSIKKHYQQFLYQYFNYVPLSTFTQVFPDTSTILRYPLCDNYPYFRKIYQDDNKDVSKVIPSINGYPNPTQNELTVQTELINSEINLSIKIYNVLGELVLEKENILKPKGENNVKISVEELNTGIYILMVEGNETVLKFYKE